VSGPCAAPAPAAFTAHWQPLLDGLDWRLLIIHPELEVVIERGATRQKWVPAAIVREQHAACERWPEPRRLDTSGFSIEESVRLAARAIAAEAPRSSGSNAADRR